MERFIKRISSTMFVHPAYSMDGTGPSIVVSGPHEEFFNSDFGIWIGGNVFRFMLQTNKDSQSMEVFMNKAVQSGNVFKSEV